MKIKNNAVAGSLESNDALVMVEKFSGVKFEVESIVEKQFKDRIEKVVRDVIEENKLEDIFIKIEDKGALDCVLKARIETALKRGGIL